MWDEKLQKYVLFHRQLTEKSDPETGTGPRYIVRQESDDLVEWYPRQTVFHPMSERWTEVESMKVYRYEGLYLGLPSNHRSKQDSGGLETVATLGCPPLLTLCYG